MGVNVYTIGVLDEIIPGRVTESIEVEAESVAEAFLEARTVGRYRTKALTVLSAWPKPAPVIDVFTDTPAGRLHRSLAQNVSLVDSLFSGTDEEYMATQEGRYLSDEDEVLDYDNADDNYGGW